ncbi:GNAT family N-acetyltransferase [Streptomyces sp. CAU 1734]|uniref:GNAT family N-acetyltransferase n=1 Tax=Streptomyces sp. CAU 1734 TaxID=3140360 RepID=UPI003261936C
MNTDGWHLTEDIDGFLTAAGAFLRSRPARHIMALTMTARLRGPGADRYGPGATVFGRLERAGAVEAAFYRLPAGSLGLTPLTPARADTLAARLAALGHSLPQVSADHATATAFATAWHRHTGATPTLTKSLRLRRLSTLTPPTPSPPGRPRVAGDQDRDQVIRWCQGFADDVGEAVSMDAASWPGTRFADKRYTFWETPDGTPVSMAGANPMIDGMVQVDPVYTPSPLRGRGYAAAVTAAVTTAALRAGATDTVLFTDAANPTSNALYERIGYRVLTDWSVYAFEYPGAGAAPEGG